MKLNLKNIKIHNFLSLGDAEINLSNMGYTLISGINNNPKDNAKSNGSGKSSIAEAIIWALTGETFRGVKNIVNMFSEGGAYVELNFDVDEVNYKIIRYKEYEKFGNNLKFYVNGEDKSGKGIKDTNEIVSQYLPDLTTQLIGSIIILGQGLPFRFSDNSPSGRKDILEKLSKSDFMIEDIKCKLNNRKISLNNKLREVEDNLLTKTTELNLLNNQILSITKSIENLPSADVVRLKLESITPSIDTLSAAEMQYQNELTNIEQQMNGINVDIDNVNSNITESRNNIYNEFNPQIDNLNSNINNILVQLNYTKSEIARLESVTDICPTCHQKLPDVVKPDTTQQREELELLNATLDSYQAKLNSLKTQLKDELNYIEESNKQTVESLKSQRSNLSNAQAQIKSKLYATTKEKNSYNIEITKLQSQLDNLESKRIELNQQLNSTHQNIDKLNQEILYINDEQEQLNSHIAIVNKMFSIATREFRGQLLTNVIKFIDMKAKEYTKQVFGTDDISFTLDGNMISISYNGKQLESLSGGERQKIDLIIQFALRDMMCQYLNFNSNILFIDECFDGLDALGCQKIIDLITEKLSDVESIFIITHHVSELDIPYDSEIVIVKNPDGVSYIQ